MWWRATSARCRASCATKHPYPVRVLHSTSAVATFFKTKVCDVLLVFDLCAHTDGMVGFSVAWLVRNGLVHNDVLCPADDAKLSPSFYTPPYFLANYLVSYLRPLRSSTP